MKLSEKFKSGELIQNIDLSGCDWNTDNIPKILDEWLLFNFGSLQVTNSFDIVINNWAQLHKDSFNKIWDAINYIYITFNNVHSDNNIETTNTNNNTKTYNTTVAYDNTTTNNGTDKKDYGKIVNGNSHSTNENQVPVIETYSPKVANQATNDSNATSSESGSDLNTKNNTNTDKSTNKKTGTDSNNGGYTVKENTKIKGKVGVTTYQKMLEQEIQVRNYNFILAMAEKFSNEMTTGVYLFDD